MSDISKITIDKLKIVSALSDDPSIKQIISIISDYINSIDEDKELGFCKKVN